MTIVAARTRGKYRGEKAREANPRTKPPFLRIEERELMKNTAREAGSDMIARAG